MKKDISIKKFSFSQQILTGNFLYYPNMCPHYNTLEEETPSENQTMSQGVDEQRRRRSSVHRIGNTVREEGREAVQATATFIRRQVDRTMLRARKWVMWWMMDF
ncbi:hypothetical protein JTE90_019611 [Oedothorax gibbosus]|uniref:Uncharacterized protein n=1 Tax=Oedothorax gibbosus TaxID=931172 RepID=A0AAV6V446_9ARAC|nr:hypothetical protein JTE90_019611 [Oedothorax gibbosus]